MFARVESQEFVVCITVLKGTSSDEEFDVLMTDAEKVYTSRDSPFVLLCLTCKSCFSSARCKLRGGWSCFSEYPASLAHTLPIQY